MLNIVVSCTYRKRTTGLAAHLPEEQYVRLRETKGSLEERERSWRNLLTSSDLEPMPARQLYAGEHWSISLQLPEIAKGPAKLWVCSAGYGLVPVDAPLKAYSATFSPGPDSVHRPEVDELDPSDANEAWWDRLGKTKYGQKTPRTISELHDAGRNSRLMVVASERYLRALRGDLEAACLDDPDRVLLVSAGYPARDKLAPLLLPADARLQPDMGGVRQALNARLARRVLEQLKPGEGFQTTRARFKKRLEKAPKLISYDRTPMEDDEVRRFIKKEIKKFKGEKQRARHTPLLRKLRDSGRACEQSRFRRLFSEMMEA